MVVVKFTSVGILCGSEGSAPTRGTAQPGFDLKSFFHKRTS